MDASAGAAGPAATGSTSEGNSQSNSTGAPQLGGTPNGTPQKQGAQRGPDGKYTSTGQPPNGKSTQTAPPNAGEPTPTEPEFRYKDKLKIKGKEEEVDYDRETLRAELQKKRQLEAQIGEWQKAAAQAKAERELIDQSPEEYFRRRGMNLEEIAERRLAEKVKLELMDPAQRRSWELEQENTQLKAQFEAQQKAAKDFKTQVAQQRIVAAMESDFIGAIDAAGMPKTYETLAEVVGLAKALHGKGVDLSPDELVKELGDRENKLFDKKLSGLDGPALSKRLGKEATERIVKHYIAEFEKSQGLPGAPAQTIPPEEPKPAAPEFIDEAEFKRRLRSM